MNDNGNRWKKKNKNKNQTDDEIIEFIRKKKQNKTKTVMFSSFKHRFKGVEKERKKKSLQ